MLIVLNFERDCTLPLHQISFSSHSVKVEHLLCAHPRNPGVTTTPLGCQPVTPSGPRAFLEPAARLVHFLITRPSLSGFHSRFFLSLCCQLPVPLRFLQTLMLHITHLASYNYPGSCRGGLIFPVQFRVRGFYDSYLYCRDLKLYFQDYRFLTFVAKLKLIIF